MGTSADDALRELIENDCAGLGVNCHAARIPEIPLESLELIVEGKEMPFSDGALADAPIRAGELSTSYAVRYGGRASRLKRPRAFTPQQAARVIRFANDARVRRLTGILLPDAYAIRDGMPWQVTEELDLDAEQFTCIVFDEWGPARFAEERGIALGRAKAIHGALRDAYAGKDGPRRAVRHTVLSMLRAAMLFQEAGQNVHRDHKPGNLVMRLDTVLSQAGIDDTAAFLAAQEHASFVHLIDWDLAYASEFAPGSDSTTSRPVFAGTMFYTPYEIWTSTDLKVLRDPWRDVYALGMSAGVIGRLIRPERHMSQETSVAFREQQLASDAFARAASEHGYPGLDELVALCVRSRERSVRKVYDLAMRVFDGIPIGSLPEVRQAMRDRKVFEPDLVRQRMKREHFRELGRKALPWVALAAVGGLAYGGILLRDDLAALRAYEAAYAASPQSLARRVAASPEDPVAWRAYDASWVAALKRDDRELFRTDAALKRPLRIPVGFFPGAPSTSPDALMWASGTDLDAGAIIMQYLAAYELTRDESLLEPLSFYLDELKLDLSTEWNDRVETAVGRFETVLRYRDTLSRIADEHPGDVAASIGRALAEAAHGGAIGAQQFIGRWAVVPGSLDAFQEYSLTPLVALVAMDPGLMAGDPRPDIRVLRRSVILSGPRVCEALVLPDGRSFGTAMLNGAWERNLLSPHDPTYESPEGSKAVVMTDHTGLFLAQAYRVALGRQLSGDPLLAERDVAAAVRANESCMDRLDRFTRDHTSDRTRYPEFVPNVPNGLPDDAYARGRDLLALAVLGRRQELETGIIGMLSDARMRVPLQPGLHFGFLGTRGFPGYDVGGIPVRGWDFPDSRWLADMRLRGPNNLATGTIRRAYLEMRKEK